jgi:hypothetical protein
MGCDYNFLLANIQLTVSAATDRTIYNISTNELNIGFGDRGQGTVLNLLERLMSWGSRLLNNGLLMGKYLSHWLSHDRRLLHRRYIVTIRVAEINDFVYSRSL